MVGGLREGIGDKIDALIADCRMKALLMYPDRDFDPQQILARREAEGRRRRPDQDPALAPLLPWNEKALRQDLGLDIVLAAMAKGDMFLFEAAEAAVLSSLTDLGVIHYRQHVYRDCATQEIVIRKIYQIAIEAIEREQKNYWSSFGRYPAGTLSRALDVLQAFTELLKTLRALVDEHAGSFESEGFRRLFAMLKRELSDDYFAEIERHLANLRFRRGVLLSAGLGRGNKGMGYVLRRPHADLRPWLGRKLWPASHGFTCTLHPRDENGARALSEMRSLMRA